MRIVVGVSEKKGTFNGNDYHNVYIHVNREKEDVIGVSAEQIKIKFARVANIFGKSMSAADWKSLVGECISVYYNEFGNVESINILESDSNSK